MNLLWRGEGICFSAGYITLVSLKGVLNQSKEVLIISFLED
jgi:hypothetical protein